LAVGPVINAGAYKRAAGKAAGGDYAAAVDGLLDVVARINSTCPPKTGTTTGGATAEDVNVGPLVLDINLLHEFVGHSERVRVETVLVPGPGSRAKAGENDWVYGVSESDNYKFAIAPTQNVYLYIFQLNAVGEVAWLYPRTVLEDGAPQRINPSPAAEGNNPTPGGKVTTIPTGPGAWAFFSETGRNGVETFFLVVSRVRQTELEQALGAVAAAAMDQRTKDLAVFIQTAVDVPLLVREKRKGLAGEGKVTAAEEDRLVETQAGSAAYTPWRYEGTGDTIVLAWPVLHLPPRTP